MPIVASRAEAGRKTAEPRPAARVVLSHPGNAPFVQHAARALEEAGLLSAYVTTFVYQRDSALGRSLRGALSLVMRDADRQLSRRAITEVSRDLVRSHPVPEIIRMASAKSAGSVTTDRVWEVTEKWFDRGWEPSIMLEQGLAVTYRWIEGELAKAGRIPAKATAAAQ